jgi:hypothetical protein
MKPPQRCTLNARYPSGRRFRLLFLASLQGVRYRASSRLPPLATRHVAGERESTEGEGGAAGLPTPLSAEARRSSSTEAEGGEAARRPPAMEEEELGKRRGGRGREDRRWPRGRAPPPGGAR